MQHIGTGIREDGTVRFGISFYCSPDDWAGLGFPHRMICVWWRGNPHSFIFAAK